MKQERGNWPCWSCCSWSCRSNFNCSLQSWMASFFDLIIAIHLSSNASYLLSPLILRISASWEAIFCFTSAISASIAEAIVLQTEWRKRNVEKRIQTVKSRKILTLMKMTTKRMTSFGFVNVLLELINLNSQHDTAAVRPSTNIFSSFFVFSAFCFSWTKIFCPNKGFFHKKNPLENHFISNYWL